MKSSLPDLSDLPDLYGPFDSPAALVRGNRSSFERGQLVIVLPAHPLQEVSDVFT